ncbi:MAG: OmpA family protein [Verrucomicrobiota bacterium]
MDKKTAFIFFGIILIGLVISLVSLNTCSSKVEVVDSPPAEKPTSEPEPTSAEPTEPGEESKSESPASTGSEPEVPTSEPAAPAMIERKTFANPKAAMTALTGVLGSKNYDDLVRFVGEGVVVESAAPVVKKVVESPALSIDAEKPFTEISKAAKSVRWSVNYAVASEGEGATGEAKPVKSKESAQTAQSEGSASAGSGSPAPKVAEAAPVAPPAAASVAPLDLPLLLYADLEMVGEGKQLAFQRISVPLDLKEITETAPSDAIPGGAPAPEAVDALTVAHAFSKAIVARDFDTARKLSDPPSVTDERIAALMIAIEEGDFDLREERPLVVTLSREDITWVLTRVQSSSQASEFAVELGQIEEAWKVNGLTFSKVLSALAEAGGGGDIAYSTIVEDPMGGDSLVLYFEFDDDGVTPRAQRQLAIIADILSQGTERVIRINGHADALGTDAYNEGLSNNRAEAIRRALISMGVSPDQIVTESFGETKPRRPNFLPDGSDNPTGRSKNRRAEVYLDF